MQASSSCDGTVRVWCLTASKELQSWRWGPASNDFGNSPSLCRIHFEPTTGRYLAVPFFQSSTVKILERSSWKEVAELVDDRLKDVSISKQIVSNLLYVKFISCCRFPFVAGLFVASF